jgi:UDP-N-acetylglucosamine 2-epimerase (non-hydrolysing)
MHFAPTAWAAGNLRAEGVPEERIFITGNTGIDAVLYVREGLETGRLAAPAWTRLDPERKLLVVTAHRRESFGEGFERICRYRCAARSAGSRTCTSSSRSTTCRSST